MNDLEIYKFFTDAIVNKHFCFQNNLSYIQLIGEVIQSVLDKDDCKELHIYDIGACYGIIIYYLNSILNTKKAITYNYIDPVELQNYIIPYKDSPFNKDYQDRDSIINNLKIQLNLNKNNNRSILFFKDYTEVNRSIDSKLEVVDIFILEAINKVHLAFFEKVFNEGLKKNSFIILKTDRYYTNLVLDELVNRGFLKKINKLTYRVQKTFLLKNFKVKIKLNNENLPFNGLDIRDILKCQISNSNIPRLREKLILENANLSLSFDEILEIT